MNTPSLPLMLATCLAIAGCSSDRTSEPVNEQLGATPDGGADAGEDGGMVDASPVTEGSVGMVAVDVQEVFVDTAANVNIVSIIHRTKNAFQLAGAHNVPFFITFEASKNGDHSLHAPLKPVLPLHAKDFIKTAYDATKLPSFSEAITQSGLSHLIVLGAETDVCVLQTVLGLRAMGFTVMLQSDAVFTSETNTYPALRRMQQAGVHLVGMTDVEGYITKSSELPKGGEHAVKILEPLHVGVVLNDFTDASVSGSADPLMTQKSARLRELLLVSEWFELPVYVADVDAGLPAAFAPYFNGQLRPILQIEQDSSVEQLVFAGTDGGVADSISAWMKSREIFVMEDALLALGAPGAQKEMLAPLFDQGLVPTTYKTFYYEMTQSVSVSEWPSEIWVQKYDEYYWITQAPEDLPPITGD